MSGAEHARRMQSYTFARTLGIPDGDRLHRAAIAIWSNLNPQTTTWTRALSAAGAALVAADKLSPWQAVS